MPETVISLVEQRARLVRSLLPEAGAWFASGLSTGDVLALFPQAVDTWRERLLAQLAAEMWGDPSRLEDFSVTIAGPMLRVTGPRSARLMLAEQLGFVKTSGIEVALTAGLKAAPEKLMAEFEDVAVMIDVVAVWLAGFDVDAVAGWNTWGLTESMVALWVESRVA